MRPTRRLVTESPPEHLLLGRVRKVLLGPHDVGDGHLDVVDHVGEQEHRGAVATQQHEVLDGRVVERDPSANQVVDNRRSLGHSEAQDPARTRTQSAVS